MEIRVFMDLTSEKEEREKVERQLRAIPEIENILLISKKESMESFIESLGEQARHFFGLKDENPLPDTYIVKTKEAQNVANIAQQIERFKHVYKVNYGAGTVETLFTVTNTIRNVGLIFIVGLAFTAMLLIANTIKITITARGQEIEIMKLVGGTNSFIRWPFLIEGLLLGVIGTAIPITILFFGYQQLLNAVGDYLKIPFIRLLPMDPLAYQVALLLLVVGACIGVWGSVMSVRRFLSV